MNNPKFFYIASHKDWFWSHRLPLAREAQRQGFDVYAAYAGAGDDARLHAEGFLPVDLPETKSGFTPIFALRTMIAIMAALWRVRPDLVHVFTLKYAFVAGLASIVAPRVKIIHTIAGLGYLFRGDGRKARVIKSVLKPLIKIAIARDGMQCIVQNPDDLDALVNENILRRDQATLIRGSGVDVTAFKATPLPNDGLPPLVLLPTRLVWEKGIEIFIEAAAILKQRGVSARFEIAGGIAKHNPRAIRAAQMEALLDGSNVGWLGRVDDMPALLMATTLVLYPSWYGEGIPKVLLEAAACARPIITTDHAGCREAVESGVSGLLIPIKDANAAADAVSSLLNDTNRMQNMSAAAYIKAQNEFDQTIIAAQVGALYRDD